MLSTTAGSTSRTTAARHPGRDARWFPRSGRSGATSPIARALRELREEFRIIYVDHRGHGRSDKPHDAKSYAMPLRVADAVAVLDGLGIERAHFVGISWGGRLCFGIGANAPERVRSLVIFGQQPYAIDPEGPLARWLGRRSVHRGSGASRRSSRRSSRSPAATPSPSNGVPRERRGRDAGCLERRDSRRSDQRGPRIVGGSVPHLRRRGRRGLLRPGATRRRGDPRAEFVSIEATDHLGMDTAEVDPVLPAILRTLRVASDPSPTWAGGSHRLHAKIPDRPGAAAAGPPHRCRPSR